MKVAVIGAGAAGFFAAINAKENNPNLEIEILEKSDKHLSKVKISGGGRCNVTHACFKISELIKFYPRGGKKLKKAFPKFNTNHTVEWFEKKGVALKKEEDNRMFPVSNNSQTIIDCLVNETKRLQISIQYKSKVESISKTKNGFDLKVNSTIQNYDKIIIACGGSPKIENLTWLANLGHNIIPPVPSLFTFNMPNESIKELMGTVAKNSIVKISGTSIKTDGPLLITHWGMSGPAILKASAWGARELAERNYQFKTLINWVGESNEEQLRIKFNESKTLFGKKQIGNHNPFDIPNKLWLFILNNSQINTTLKWAELGKKPGNKLINNLLNGEFQVEGKTTFKEEFVTCGGIDLSNVNFNTMESLKCPGIYFAGELLDIDGVTGGFNFQAAWTTGFIAGTSL